MRVQSITLLLALGVVAGCGSGGGGAQAGSSTPMDSGYQEPPSGYQAPSAGNTPSASSPTAPASYEQPPGTFSAPPGQQNPDGTTDTSLTAACTRFCNAILSLNCPGIQVTGSGDTGSQSDSGGNQTPSGDQTPSGNQGTGNDTAASPAPESCSEACAYADTEIPAACADATAAIYNCVVDDISLTCDLLTSLFNGGDSSDLENQIETTCAEPGAALAECDGATTQPTQPTPAQPGGGTCQEASGCTNCANDCDSCHCALGADSTSCTDICGN